MRWLDGITDTMDMGLGAREGAGCGSVGDVPGAWLAELEQIISQFVWKNKKPQKAKTILRKKNGTGGINLLDFRLCYKATVIKTVWYWHKDRTKQKAQR